MHVRSLLLSLPLLTLLAPACDKPDPVPQPRPGDIEIRADERGFSPSKVEIKKGEPGRLIFKRTTDDTCAKDVVFPELAIDKRLPLNHAVAVEVPVNEARTLTFQCGMGMYKSTVVVN
jgi:plastocyanin domain-containing protein